MTVETIFIDTGDRRDPEYLGDGVYADHDDIQVWVHTPGAGQAIALDHDVLSRLVEYAKRKGLA